MERVRRQRGAAIAARAAQRDDHPARVDDDHDARRRRSPSPTGRRRARSRPTSAQTAIAAIDEADEDEDRRLREGGEVLGLPVPVLVRDVGRPPGDADREEGQQRCDEVGRRSAPPRRAGRGSRQRARSPSLSAISADAATTETSAVRRCGLTGEGYPVTGEGTRPRRTRGPDRLPATARSSARRPRRSPRRGRESAHRVTAANGVGREASRQLLPHPVAERRLGARVLEIAAHLVKDAGSCRPREPLGCTQTQAGGSRPLRAIHSLDGPGAMNSTFPSRRPMTTLASRTVNRSHSSRSSSRYPGGYRPEYLPANAESRSADGRPARVPAEHDPTVLGSTLSRRLPRSRGTRPRPADRHRLAGELAGTPCCFI